MSFLRSEDVELREQELEVLTRASSWPLKEAEGIEEGFPAIAVTAPARSFGGVLGSEELHAGMPQPPPIELEDELGDDEGMVSIVDLDSAASSTLSDRQPAEDFGWLGSESPEGATSVLEPGDTERSSQSLVTNSQSLQPSGRTVPGEALTLQGSLNGELTNLLQQLTLESLPLDESLIHSVRRVMQLGTVLTGQRLSEDEIRALPKIVFSAAEQQSCRICLEFYQQGEFLTSLQCGHFFHVDCLARWFQRSTQCPLCRSECTD